MPMAFDLILRNARLGAGRADRDSVDIAIANGRIVSVGARIDGAGASIDAGGRFVSPGLVESHFHLDKARILDRVAAPKDRQTRDHVVRTSAIKHTFTVEDVYARARDTLEQGVLNGVTHMRTQVEVDPNIDLRGFEAIEQLRKDYAWAIDIQVCAFLQEGWTNSAGGEANVVAALKRGASVVGGVPRYDPDRPGQIRRIFALAEEFDVDVDIHLDGGHTIDDLDIDLVCELTDKIGWGGRVAIGHGSKYSCMPLAQLAQVGRRMADSGVSLEVLPATDLFNSGRHMEHTVMRGVADAHALIGFGANCAIATNNVLNAFTPYGDCSLVRVANLYANVVQRGTEDDMAECFAMLTERAARILRLVDYGIAPGDPADLVVWNARTPAEVIASVAQPVMGFKRGRRLFTREIATLMRP
jgi:cytosine deaminase